MQAIKKVVLLGRSLPPEYALQLAEALEKPVRRSEDAVEGLRAFVEKRKPQWKAK